MPESSKERVRALFAGKQVTRPLFIPLMATAAAQFMQVPIRQMFSDPTTLANSLQACQRLFKYDAVVTSFDSTLEAEACGCRIAEADERQPESDTDVYTSADVLEHLDVSGIEVKGRIPVIIEAAKRLTQTIGRDVALLGVITGPITFGQHLLGNSKALAITDNRLFDKLIDFWGNIALALARAYGEMNLDGIVVADKKLVSIEPSHYAAIQPAFKTLSNLVRFYDAPVIIHAGEVTTDKIDDLLQLDVDGLSYTVPAAEQTTLRWPAGKICGKAIPSSILYGSNEGIEQAIREIVKNSDESRCFITTEWEVPQETPAVNLHKIRQVLDNTFTK